MKTMIIAVISVLASVALAAPYGEAGCGLGSMIFQNNDNQVLAATTNGTSGNQTFGISSGTSNCVDGGHMRATMQVPAFIEVNRLALAKDAARGQGETVAGLAQLMGCDAALFGPALKAHYQQIFVNTNMQPAAMEASIHSMLKANNTRTCGSSHVATN
jgi:hypothetical protein